MHRLLLGLLLSSALLPSVIHAQTDEIQVYTGELAAVGEFTLVDHNNFTFQGNKTAAFPGGVAPHHTLNGVTEWAYGVTDWYEAGLYLPVYTVGEGHYLVEGAKLRALFAVPHAETRDFFYGINFEFSFNAKRWDEKRNTGEIRPIIGWRNGKWDFIVNPILDTSFDGLNNLDFAPGVRVAYNYSDKWAYALEDYSDFGPIRHFESGSDQQHSVFAVVDYSGKPTGVEFGIGRGINGDADKVVVKLMLMWSLNR